ncbi:MAG: hypothetical protein EOO11_11020 [Chitinophagaceae bacterium]|nr:MAG: hypothetical protein EOO11_11020 [Chitinophagaceae bacterium]
MVRFRRPWRSSSFSSLESMLREWAYAGFTINLLGAAWSHAAVGDPVAAPLVLLLLLAGSYLTGKRAAYLASLQRPLQTRFA